MSEKEIKEFWKSMPLFYLLQSDTAFDNAYGFKGFVFLFSLLLFPLTFILYGVGKVLSDERNER